MKRELFALPKQLEFLRSKAPQLLFSGAFGAGKTRSLAMLIVQRASHKGAVEALVRKHLVSLRATTLKTLLEPDGELPPPLPEGSYVHNKMERRIRIKGGGEIIYFGIDDTGKLGSYGLTGAAVDEATELSEDDWDKLRGRCRVKVTGLRNQIYGATNPGPPSHFLAKRFGLALGHKPAKGCAVIHTKATDNFTLSEEYLELLDSFEGVARKRYRDGLWVGSDGLVYSAWDRDIFERERPDGDFHQWILGVDDGFKNPAAILLIGVDGDDRLHVAREWYERGRQAEEIAVEVKRLVKGLSNVFCVVVDPSSPRLIEQIRATGLPVEGGENDLRNGIRTVQDRFKIGDDKLPRLTVSPSCENLSRELESYENRRDPHTGEYTDVPVKNFDHACDALRYAVMKIDGVFSLTKATSSVKPGVERFIRRQSVQPVPPSLPTARVSAGPAVMAGRSRFGGR